jgi:hypothetical protein
MKLLILAASLATCAAGLGAQGLFPPTEASVVKAQGDFARIQLESLSALLSAMPAAVAKESFASGNAAIDWAHWSPALGGVARGPTLAESLNPLLSNLAAAKSACAELDGPCQARARAWGAARASSILKSPHPGKALAMALSEK